MPLHPHYILLYFNIHAYWLCGGGHKNNDDDDDNDKFQLTRHMVVKLQDHATLSHVELIQRLNNSVFRRLRNTGSDLDDGTSSCKL